MRAGLVLLALTACCPDPDMAIIDGNTEHVVRPGDVVQLEARFGDWRSGPGRCGARWYVNYVEGGTSELGTIDACGRYQAPAAFPPGLEVVAIEASENALHSCADCCPYAYIELYPRP